LALSLGSRLGPYEIVALLGVGGMGEVYRATDSNLKRSVAIKVLPASMAGDADRLARFQREAEVLATLNHPSIGAIYGVEKTADFTALVMELVEGEDLADRIAGGPIPVDEALRIATQIAGALEAAHEQGIIHRDLKPANIKLRADGTVKLLDFGLAKAIESVPGASSSPSMSPTLTSPVLMTGAGVILGTAAYMAPEQARGSAVDRRADVWAFGCVLYEMLTGTRVFASENLSDAVAAVLRSEPDWRALPTDTPARIRVLLKRCLQKDSRQRLHDVADARIEIDDRDADATPAAASPRHTRVDRATWVALSFVSGAALASGLWWVGTRPSRATPAPIHLSLTLVNQASFVHMNASRELAISPDGQKIVYVATHNGRRQLFLRALGDSEGKPMDGTDGALTAFFSPDSEWIAFGKGSELQKAAVSGGSPTTICHLSGTGFYGGDWGADDTIVFVPDYNGGLWTVSANGGTPQPLLKTDVEKDRVSYSDPQILPGGKSVLFTLSSGRAVTADDQDVAVSIRAEETPGF
jgi:serine/threonine protein kinase